MGMTNFASNRQALKTPIGAPILLVRANLDPIGHVSIALLECFNVYAIAS
jgi:hypothetical protein